MKTVIIVRHAKSSWDSDALNDFDRPLNDRGKNDAPMMAKRLLKKKINIDAFISSPAKRARKTAELFMDEYGKKQHNIILISALYHAALTDFYDVIENADDTFNDIAIFSHNSGITNFANSLAENIRVDNMPTCSVLGIKVFINHWEKFSKAKKELLFFDYPKNV